MSGVAGEDNINLNRADNKAVRRRSLRLLGQLLRPHRGLFALTIAFVVLSNAARAAGPVLIAYAIDHALPELSAGNNRPLILVAGGYLMAACTGGALLAAYIYYTAKLSQAMLLALRLQV